MPTGEYFGKAVAAAAAAAADIKGDNIFLFTLAD